MHPMMIHRLKALIIAFETKLLNMVAVLIDSQTIDMKYLTLY